MDDEKKINDVPYIVFEGSMARSERHIKRLVIALIFAILGIVATNIAWLIVWNSYEYVGEDSSQYSEIVVDSGDGGNANYNHIGHDGDITNGEDNCEESDH